MNILWCHFTKFVQNSAVRINNYKQILIKTVLFSAACTGSLHVPTYSSNGDTI